MPNAPFSDKVREFLKDDYWAESLRQVHKEQFNPDSDYGYRLMLDKMANSDHYPYRKTVCLLLWHCGVVVGDLRIVEELSHPLTKKEAALLVYCGRVLRKTDVLEVMREISPLEYPCR